MDVFEKYGSGSVKSGGTTSQDLSIFDKYGSGVEPTATPVAQQSTYTPQNPYPGSVPAPPNASGKQWFEAPPAVSANPSTLNPAMSDIASAPGYVARQATKNYREAKSLTGQGIVDIAGGKSATGVGETVMGGIGQIAAWPQAVIQGADKFAQRLVGNKDFTPTELITTTGLPIAKVGQVAVKAMPSVRAIEEIVNAIGKENIPKVLDELKSNPRLTLMDVDPNIQSKNLGLATEIGEPHRALRDFNELRKADQKDVVTQAYDEAMGTPVSVKAKVDTLKKNIKSAGAEITPVVKAAGPVDITPVIASIDAKLKPGITSVITAGEALPGPRVKEELAEFRKYLTDDKSNRIDAGELHSIQAALRHRAENLLNSQSGQDREVGYALMNVRKQIVDAIDKASPQITDATTGNTYGSYRPKLAKFRDENQIQEAFEKGQLITRNRLGRLEDHPDYWQEWISNASPEELEAAKEGARLSVAYQMGAFKNASKKAMDIPQSEFNAEKLGMLFGVKETSKLMKALNDERKINETDTKLFQNSKTALAQAAQKANEVREKYRPNASAFLPAAAEIGAAYATGGASTGLVAPSIIGYHAVRHYANKAGQALDRKKNLEVAHLSMATGEAKDKLIKALQDYIPKHQLSVSHKLKLAFPTNP